MTSAVFVLFTRALNLDASRFTTYLLRMALVFVIVFVLVDAQASAGSVGAPGLRFFEHVGYVTLAFITVASIFLFAVVISEEKEESTIGLLKMAGLSPVSILLGKGGSRLVFGLLLLLAQFPFTLLAVTLGGTSLAQIFAGYCTVISFLVFAGALGLFASVWARTTSRAISMTIVLLFLFLLGPPCAKGILYAMRQADWISASGAVFIGGNGLTDQVILADPFVRLAQITTTGFDESPAGFQVVSNLVGGVVFFLLSWAVFERRTAEDKSQGPSRAFAFARNSRLSAVGVGRVWKKALAWKEYYFGTGGLVGSVVRFVVVGGIFALVCAMVGPLGSGYRLFGDYVGDALMITALVAFYVDFLIQVARTLNSEWRLRTLPALVILPVSTSRLFFDKLLGCLMVGIPHGILFGIGVLLSPEDFFTAFGNCLVHAEFYIVVLYAILFLYLTAWMTLLLKWLGLLAAVAIAWFGSGVFAVIAFQLFGSGGSAFALIIIMVALLAFMHVCVLRLIERRAGE